MENNYNFIKEQYQESLNVVNKLLKNKNKEDVTTKLETLKKHLENKLTIIENETIKG